MPVKKFLFIALIFFSLTASAQKTSFGKETGEYGVMLTRLENIMLNYQQQWQRSLGGKQRTVFVPWIRDNVHVMKAMKFIHPDVTSFLEYFLQNQTDEGIYFDYYYPIGERGISDRMQLFGPRYWKIIPEDSIQMHRLPVEADLEYLLVEGVYDVWQATGDSGFVKKWLTTLAKGIRYDMTDPLRWSSRYQLIKRGYTLDTWDFMQLPSSREEYTRNGGNVQKGIFNVDEHTPMGIMHGDNSGLYAACGQLATMFSALGSIDSADYWRNQASAIRKRTNDLCWNGKFYAHFVEDDPMPDYLHIDQKNTLSLSNPYDINRGLPTKAMAQSIIHTYKQLKESTSDSSFAEWYGIYPAVQPHYADYQPGSYMNGGVNTIVAGELAKAALMNGYEKYGVDILQRLWQLLEKYKDSLPVSYTPKGVVDAGIPDNWGQAAIYSAMIEGLAGVYEKDRLFKKVELSPRWMAAGKDSASVHVEYAASGVALSYKYIHDPVAKKITLQVEGDIDEGRSRILLPASVKVNRVTVNGKKIKYSVDVVNKSNYVVSDKWKGKQAEIIVYYYK
jgi:hypothetical protein